MPERPPDDPISSRSYSQPILIASFLLALTLAWALYQEFFGLRPWRSYQRRFAGVYATYLRKQVRQQRALEDSIYAAPEYKKLRDAADAAERAAAPADKQIGEEISLLDRQRAAMLDKYQEARGRVGSLVYQYEIVPAGDKRLKQSRMAAVLQAKKATYEVAWPIAGGKTERRELTYDQLNQTFTDLMAQRAALIAKRGEVDTAAKETRQQLNEYVAEKLPGPSSAALEGLLHNVESMDINIRQINVNPPGTQINWLGGAELVDRCQSCHVGMDPQLVPVTMKLIKADLGLERSHDAPFTSHPDPELLKWHPLDKFGCSPCHGGNGRALDTVRRAHGRYEHWLWPLYYPENYEAGCQQCHAADMWTEHAPTLTLGKELYRLKGCIGCHRFQGFDNEDEQLVNTRQKILQLGEQKKQDEIEIPRLQKAGDEAPDNATAQKYYAQATNLTVRISQVDAQVEQLEQQSHSLLQEIKKVGPDLKEVRMKLRKEWIPYWLEHTHQFRPTTKMPQFRLEPDEIEAISAFIWQSGLTGPPLDHQKPGDSVKGKQLFEERGCLACHSIGEGANQMGGDFAANLSRVGEKDNYDYLVRWIHNPRVRTRPYCPYERRDLGPEDYRKHGLPFVFDLDHSRCPNDGHELVVEQQTVMPSLRLTWEEARDIASYLMTHKHAHAPYPPAPFLNDPKLEAQGQALVRHYGCAGCHEIAGLEDEGRIGTELTDEGSKPIERLDFSLFTEDAKRGLLPNGKPSPRGPWYDTKGFLEEKLSNPAVFDQGKYKPDPMDRLRMPKPNLRSKQELDALVTFVLGSTDPTLPPSYRYKPVGPARAIQEGWWIITKYNCIGCHQIDIGQKTVLMGLPQYQGENKINLPPVLTSEGARVNPEWLKKFLANPALSTTDAHRNGVRSYLQVRMPTFFLSDDEIRKLVLFFEAMSSQEEPYIPPKIQPLTAAERAMARALFTSPAAPCLKCHATGNPVHDKTATAPNFLLAKDRLRPAWTERWLTDPAKIIPGTAMPSGLFRREDGRWIFNGPLPLALQKYPGDHRDLLVRYMFELTPQEQAALMGRASARKTTGSSGN